MNFVQSFVKCKVSLADGIVLKTSTVLLSEATFGDF